MFESIVADFLSRYLGQYIDGFDPKQLKIGIWKGQIEYHNIKLKVDVLNSFSLPISIKDGAVRSLSLSIPWHNLKGGNIEITLDGIYLLARPAEVAESETIEQEQQRELLNKQARLMRAEMLKATKLQPKSTPSSSGGGGMSQGLLLRLLTTVVDKVQITVRNVHLRYEDHLTNPRRGFAVGVTLEELSLHTTPAQTMSAVYQRLIHKVLTVRNLALYWTADPPVQYTSVSEMIHVMDQFIARGNQATSARPLQYVLAPVTCHVQLQVNPSDHVTSATDVPKIDARIRLEPINLSLSEAQYSDAMCLLTALTNHATRVKHARLRPRMTPHDNPRAWWSYLATLLLSQVRARKHRWSSEYFTERRRQRLEYIKLYKRLLHKTLSLNGRARLDHLEVVLSYDDILLFRAWAELELKREGRAVAPRSGYVASVTSWAKSWFTRKSSGDEADDETVESRVEITDEMRKEFLNTIDYQPNTATASRDQVPADWIDARVEFSMPLLGLTLSHVTGPVCAVALREFIVRMNHRARGVQLHAELGTVEATSLLIRDHVTPLIRMLDSAPLLSCHVESNHNDYDLTLLLTPLEVRVDKDILHALTGMLTRHHTPSIQHIEIAAKYQLKRIGRRTRRHVERQMKQSSSLTVRCDVDVALPRIVVAHGTEQGGRCELTVSLGHIRAQHNEDTARTGTVTSANEFSVVWEDIHVNAVTAVNAHHAPHNHTVLQPVTVTADILLGTLASAAQARVKVRSSVSLLSMRVTPELLQQLLPLVQDLVPAPSLNESSDSVNGVAMEETVLQTDETILQLYDVVDADQSASEDEEELSDERAIDKSEYELIKTAECTLDLAGVEIQLRDDKSPRNLRLYLGPVVIGVLAREGELTANLLLREVRVSDGQHGDWLHTQGHPEWLTAHVRMIDSNSPRYNGVAHIVKLTLGTLTLCIVPPSVTNALNLVAAFTPPTAAPRDVPTVPAKTSRASSSPSELSSKVLVHMSSVIVQALDDTRAAVTTVTLHDLTAQIDLKAEYQRVKGYIGNLRVMDCTGSDPRVVLTKSRDDITWVDFNLIHLRNPRELANPLIRAHVKQLSVTAHLDHVTALLNYSAHLTAALPVMDQSRDVVSDTLPPAVSVPVKRKVPRHLPKYQIIVEAPELIVLVRNEQRHVIGQLVFTGGDLLLFNTSRWTEGQSRDLLDTINVTWTGCQLTYQPLLTDAGTQHVISNLAVVAAVERVYSRHVLTTPHLTVRCTVSPVIFAVNQQICDVFATLFSEWTKHQSRAPIAHIDQSANANIPGRLEPVAEVASRAPVAESHVSVFVHLEELAVKLDGVNQCATTCAVHQVTARVTMDQDPRQTEVHTRVRAAVESIQITAHQRHVEDLVLLGPASHVTVLGRRADHVIGHEPLMQIDLHQSQSALLDHLELRVKLMPLRAVCVIDTLTRLVNSATPVLNLTSALTPVTPSTPAESVTRVNPAPVSRAINTREIEVVVKELELTVPENSEVNNSSSVKVLSLKTDLVASVQLNATGTHVHTLLQHTDLALLDLLNKQGNFDIQRSQLLDPIELVVTAHLTPHESRAEVTAQPLLLRISFMDLVLFNQLATAFTTAPFIAQLQSRAASPSASRDTRSTSTSATNSTSGTELTVVLSNVQLTVIDDSLIGQTFSLPLIECSLNPVTLHLTLHGDIKATARVGVQCNFFNPQSMQWESLLHPLTAHLALAQHAQRTTAQCRIADPVALAVSQPLVQVASRAAEVLATLFSRQFQHTTRTPRSRGRAPALVLRNAVGRAIKWGHSSVVHELKDHSEVTLAQTGTHDTQLTLALQVTPFKPYHAVPVLTNRYSALHSALALTLSPHPKNTHRVKLLWEDWHDYAADLHYSLSRRGGMLTVDSETSSEAVTRDTSRMTRVKRLRTGIRIANGLPSSTAVGYTPAAVYLTSAKHGTVSRTLAPLADWPVPLDLLLQDDTRITVTLQHNLVNNAADLERRGRRRERGPVSVSEDSTLSDSEHEDDSSERYLDVDLEAEVDDEGSLSLWELLSVIQEARRQRAARDSAADDESGVLALTPLTDPALRERSALIEPDEVDHVPVSVYISVPQCVLQLTAFSENNVAVVVQPHVIVENLLPALMWFKLRDARNHVELMEQCVNRGELVPIFCTSATMRQLQLSVKIEGYGWSTWATINNTRTPDQSLALLDDQQRTLHLTLDYAVSGTRTVSVYSKYWLINRTGLPIQYRAAGAMQVTAGLHSIDAPNTDPTLDPKLWYRTVDRSHLNPLVLYSGLDPAQSKNRLHVQVSDAQWSQELNIDTVGWSGVIQLAQSTHQYALVSSIQLATPSKYFRTKVVTFAPRYVLVNHTGHVLYYRQEHTAHVYSLAPYEQLPFHPLDTPHSCKLSVTPRPDEWLWSGYFAVDKLGELSVNIRDSNNQIKKLMRVEVTVAHGTNFVTLRAESVHHPPYRIDNHSPESVLVYQKGHKHLAQQLTPYESQPYAWEQPSMPHVLVIELPRYSFTREIELDQIATHECSLLTLPTTALTAVTTDTLNNKSRDSSKARKSPLFNGVLTPTRSLSRSVSRARTQRTALKLRPVVTLEGPTRVLRLTDDDVHGVPDSRARALRVLHNNNNNTGNGTERQVPPSPPHSQSFELEVDMHSLGVSVVTLGPKELLYLNCQRIHLGLSATRLQQAVELLIDHFQVDNQLLNTDCPVVVSSLHSAPNTAQHKPFAHISLVKSLLYTDLEYYHYCAVALQEVAVIVDETLLNELFSFISSFSRVFESDVLAQLTKSLYPLAPSTPVTSINNVNVNNTDHVTEEVVAEKKLYFEMLLINPIKLTLSFASGDPTLDGRPSLFSTVLRAAGVSLGNIDSASILFNALALQNPFLTRNELVSYLAQHYKALLLRQAYKLFGALEVLGSPLSLIRHVGTGVYDFFYEPAQSLVTNPKDFVKAMAKGTSSLVTKSLFGLLHSLSNISGSLSKATATLTMDKAYVRTAQTSRTPRTSYAPRDLPAHLHRANQSRAPVVSRTSHVLNELTSGMMSVIFKPITVLLHLLHKSSTQLRNSVAVVMRDLQHGGVIMRCRPSKLGNPSTQQWHRPRHQPTLEQYRYDLMSLVLISTERGAYKDHLYHQHWLLHHAVKKRNKTGQWVKKSTYKLLYIFSDRALFCITPDHHLRLNWLVYYTDIHALRVEGNQLVVIVKQQWQEYTVHEKKGAYEILEPSSDGFRRIVIDFVEDVPAMLPFKNTTEALVKTTRDNMRDY